VANQSNTSRGILADKLGWVSFFMVTTVATVPALALLVWLARSAAPSDQPLPLSASTKL
jgi:sugar phosphate permease